MSVVFPAVHNDDLTPIGNFNGIRVVTIDFKKVEERVLADLAATLTRKKEQTN